MWADIGFARSLMYQLLAQATQSGAAIENVQAVAQADFDAGGVASVAQFFRLGGWR